MENKIAITIGRSYGSGGAEVGRKLADALGVDFYDKEILEEQVKKSGFTNEYLSDYDEKKKTSSFLYSVFMNPESIMVHSGFGNEPMDLVIQRVQIQTIKEIAERGSCVIVGRRADRILKDNHNVFSIFITADDETRVARVAERENLNRKDAENRIRRMDRNRKSYYNYYGDSGWGEASGYDMCLSTSRLGIDGCVSLILEALKLQKLI